MKHSGGALLSSITIDKGSKQKISTQVFMGIRDIILSEGLKAGERLPASRTLAIELSVSRTTVIDALERLISEGLLEARSGAGTFVSDVMQEDRPSLQNTHLKLGDDNKEHPVKLSNTIEKALPDLIARDHLPKEPRCFITGLPALDEFPMSQWLRLSSKNLRGERSNIMGYGQPFGLQRLRSAIASHINASRGILCNPQQIFITGGAQHAFQLISSMLLNSNDKVWIENPSAIGARNSLIANGAKLIPVNVDKDGIIVSEGLKQAPDFKLAFVTPSHQQPLSIIMSLKRRFSLLVAAEDADAWIIEDDYDSEFHFEGQPVPTLKSVDTNDRVIYVGTFSKSIFPSLRIGFIISPLGLVDPFEKIFNSIQSGVPTHSQAVISDFMDEGYFATHIRRMRSIYAERYHALRDLSELYLPEFLDIQPTQSGLHTVGFLKQDTDEVALSLALDKKGVSALPLSRYCLKKIDNKGFTLGFGAVNPDQIKSSIIIMADTFNELI